jgi:hypothetical protein
LLVINNVLNYITENKLYTKWILIPKY